MKSKAINANREIKNRQFNEFMLTVEVDLPKTVYEVFVEATKHYGECQTPVPPELIMQHYLTAIADKIEKKEISFIDGEIKMVADK